MEREWENDFVKEGKGERCSRYIASWVVANKQRELLFDDRFKDWLRSNGLSEDEVWKVWQMATCGKMELEMDARKFMKENPDGYVKL